jgi:hypothetical protein
VGISSKPTYGHVFESLFRANFRFARENEAAGAADAAAWVMPAVRIFGSDN